MEYMPAKDYTAVTPDPSVGAVLCGFDAFVSEFDVHFVLIAQFAD